MSLPDLYDIARRIDSPLFQGAREQFAAKQGLLEYASGGRSHYYEDPNTTLAGTIYINTDDIPKLARYYGDAEGVVRALLIHEMGHFMYRFRDRATQPRNA